MQEYIPFFQAEKRSIAEKLAKYFEYSGLETKIHFDEGKDAYILSVPSNKEKEAKKYYQAFYFVERDRIENDEKDIYPQEELDESRILLDSSDEVASADMDDLDSEDLNLYNSDSDNSDSNDVPYTDSEADTGETPDISDASNTDEAPYTNDAPYINEASNSDYDSSLKQSDISHEDIMADEDTDIDSENLTGDLENEQKSQVKSLLSGSGSYVMKAEKYKDYVGTQYVFLVLGIAGIIFVILNVIEVLTLLYGLFPNLIMGALFVYFIYVGISTGKKARQLKNEIDDEEQLTDKIKEWLKTTVTDEYLASISNSEISEELDYIKKTDTIRDMLNKEFGEQNRDYLDRLIEEFYTETFDASSDYTEEEVK